MLPLLYVGHCWLQQPPCLQLQRQQASAACDDLACHRTVSGAPGRVVRQCHVFFALNFLTYAAEITLSGMHADFLRPGR